MSDFIPFRNVPTARRQAPPWVATTKAAPSDTTTRVPSTQVRWGRGPLSEPPEGWDAHVESLPSSLPSS